MHTYHSVELLQLFGIPDAVGAMINVDLGEALVLDL